MERRRTNSRRTSRTTLIPPVTPRALTPLPTRSVTRHALPLLHLVALDARRRGRRVRALLCVDRASEAFPCCCGEVARRAEGALLVGLGVRREGGREGRGGEAWGAEAGGGGGVDEGRGGGGAEAETGEAVARWRGRKSEEQVSSERWKKGERGRTNRRSSWSRRLRRFQFR